jgi:chemotaxis protein methyltransferase CheR
MIFCRNVLIYFNPETKLRVLSGLYESLADDGVLILGSCENVMSDKSGFIPNEIMHGLYSKKPLPL